MKYEQVFIKSEKDLPKEAGWYFLHWKHPDERMHTQMGCQYYDESIKGLWLDKDWFDWYLQPIPEITDEDIEAWVIKEFEGSMIIPEKAAFDAARAMRDGEIKHKEK